MSNYEPTARENELIDYLDEEAEIEIESAGELTELGKQLRRMETTARWLVSSHRALWVEKEALEARVAAADKLAELCNSFRAVLDSPVGQALAAYEATKDQSDG